MIQHRGVDTKIVDDQIIDLLLREQNIHESHNMDKHYPHLVQYRDELLVEELIAKTLEKSLNGWGEKDQYILNNVEVKKYKEMILTNPDFVLDVKEFVKKGDEDKYFSQAVKNIKQALNELATQSKDNRFRVEKILKDK